MENKEKSDHSLEVLENLKDSSSERPLPKLGSQNNMCRYECRYLQP